MAVVCALLGAGWLLCGPGSAQAKPRPPFPPYPEISLAHFGFDDPMVWGGLATDPFQRRDALWVESWSGYALRMAGAGPALAPLPALDESKQPNLRIAQGTIRFWFRPYWSSGAVGGKGPGAFGRLIELGAWTPDARYGWFSLYLEPKGDAVRFSSQGEGRAADYLRVPIHWKAGEWHQVALVYAGKFTALYLDGELAAHGDGVTHLPGPGVIVEHGLCVGSDSSGQNLAQGEFDELTTFDNVRTPVEMALNYGWYIPTVRLGPISPEEEAELRRRAREWAAARAVREEDQGAAALMPEGGGGAAQLLSSGLQISIPRFFSNGVYQPGHQGTNVAFTVINPEPDAIYDLLFTPSLSPPIQWTLLQQGLPGQTNFAVPNPGLAHGFYQLCAPPFYSGPYPTNSPYHGPDRLVGLETSVVGVPALIPFYAGVTLNVPAGSGSATGLLGAFVLNGTVGCYTNTPSWPSSVRFVGGSNDSASLILEGPLADLQTAFTFLSYFSAGLHESGLEVDALTLLISYAGASVGCGSSRALAIDLESVADAPLAQSDNYAIAEDGTLNAPTPGVLINDIDFDGDPLTAALVGNVSHGTLLLNADGSFTYAPAANFNGSDSFTYRASDGANNSATVTVSLTVIPVPDAPSVTLTNPVDGAGFPIGANIALGASASDPDGTGLVNQVSFHWGTNLIGVKTNAPYTLVWSNAPAGAWSLSARATDNTSLVSTSSPVVVIVAPDSDGDGIIDSIELQNGTDPLDFYNGVPPVLSIVSGNNQAGPANGILALPLVARVGRANGTPWTNAPVTFNVTEGGGQVALATNGTWVSSQQVPTGTNGQASVWFRLPGSLAVLNLIAAQTASGNGTSQVLFTAGGVITNAVALQVYTPLK